MIKMEQLTPGDRLLAKKINGNVKIIKDTLNNLINDYIKRETFTPAQFTTKVIVWLNTKSPGRTIWGIDHNNPYIGGDKGIRYAENKDININPHVWVTGPTEVRWDVENNEIGFFRNDVLVKKVTTGGWV